MGKLYDSLKAAKLGAGAASDYYTALIGQSLSKSSAQEYELTDIPPLSFNSNGKAINTWTIYGNSQQNGSPTPYSPYDVNGCGDIETSGEYAGQYKIPITNNQQTSTIYLGSIQSKRYIQKLILTGNENGWQMRSGEPSNIFFIPLSNLNINPVRGIGLCNKFSYTNGGAFSELQNNEFILSTSNLGFRFEDISSAGTWIWYLQNQYSNGTPIIMYYVVDNPITSIANEPLMKIGEYADEISDAIQLSTNKGSNILSVGTNIQPLQMYIKYYK